MELFVVPSIYFGVCWCPVPHSHRKAGGPALPGDTLVFPGHPAQGRVSRFGLNNSDAGKKREEKVH